MLLSIRKVVYLPFDAMEPIVQRDPSLINNRKCAHDLFN